jgi:hypothetical protein
VCDDRNSNKTDTEPKDNMMTEDAIKQDFEVDQEYVQDRLVNEAKIGALRYKVARYRGQQDAILLEQVNCDGPEPYDFEEAVSDIQDSIEECGREIARLTLENLANEVGPTLIGAFARHLVSEYPGEEGDDDVIHEVVTAYQEARKSENS